MKALITDFVPTRIIVWISLGVTSFMMDTRFSRLTCNVFCSILVFVYFILDNGDSPGYTAFKLGYEGVTWAFGTPWLITVLAFEAMEEIERFIERKRRRKGHGRKTGNAR